MVNLQLKKLELRNLSKRQKIVCAGVLVLITLALTILFVINNSREDNTKKVEGPPNKVGEAVTYKAGTGGDPGLVTSYHDQAVAAWKVGDKSKAKELAQKGLDANKQLTEPQMQQVPKRTQVIYDMYDITQDVYNVTP